LSHLAKDKLHTFVDGEWGQVQGEMENYMLRDLEAFENVREGLNTRTVRRPDAQTLAARVSAGPVEQASAPTPMFQDLVCRLRVAGIETVLDEDKLAFRFAPAQTGSLKLAQPVPHPWLRERSLTEIGIPATLDADGNVVLNAATPSNVGWPFPPGGWDHVSQTPPVVYTALLEANDRLARMLVGRTPQKLVDDAVAQLESRVQAFFDELLTPVHLRLSERLSFTARTVLVPGEGLTLEQVGVPEEMAWALFAPLVVRELGGDEAAVDARDARASQALDAVMARSWMILNRAPTISPTALDSYRGYLIAGPRFWGGS
jgi:hypothetical protein